MTKNQIKRQNFSSSLSASDTEMKEEVSTVSKRAISAAKRSKTQKAPKVGIARRTIISDPSSRSMLDQENSKHSSLIRYASNSDGKSDES